MKFDINNKLWGKKKVSTNGLYWLPLKQHLIDTQNVTLLLWEHWLDESQKKLIINSLDNKKEEIAKNLVGFLAGVHDIGKATPSFQMKESIPLSRDLDNALKEKLKICGIDLEKYIISDPNKSHHSLAGQVILENYGVDISISTIIGSHHGKPINSKDEIKIQKEAYRANYYQTSEDNEIHKFWENQQKGILGWALEVNGFNGVSDLPKINFMGQILLTGLIIMADWIASNEEYFPLISVYDDNVDNYMRKENGWNKWYKTSNWESKKARKSFDVYNKNFGYDPYDIQQKIFKIISSIENPSIIVIEAPMGVGKTEMGLVSVEQLAHKLGKSGLFFGLPTQATSNGIFTRVEDWLNKVCEFSDEKHSIKLMHGKASLNEDYLKIKKSLIYEEDKNVFANEWFCGKKKTILDEFVVGTVDQFLLTSLKQKHFMLKHLGFSKKVVIIDEVHSYDTYMNVYLKRALRWVGAYNVPVILLSATLPKNKRDDLIKEYMASKYKKNIVFNFDTNIDAYPSITYSDGNVINQFCDFEIENNKIIEIEKTNLDPFEIIKDVIGNEDGILGVIVNTVKKAQELTKKCIEIYGIDTVELLHSNLIDTDRSKREKNLLNIIGKEKNRPKKKIIIGTQVIEQSLDIDFDVLISEIAPMDLLLQRIGRLHRHKSVERVDKFKNPKFYIFGVNEEYKFEEGTKHVYDEYILTKTQHYLPNRIEIPKDIKRLIQNVYGEENEVLEKELNDIKEKFENKISKKEKKAKTFLLDKPKENKNMIGMLDLSLKELSEERSYAQVRDIDCTIEVIVIKKYESGYSIFGYEKDVSRNLEKYAKELSKNTLRLPRILSINSKITDETIKFLEEYNNKYLREWQENEWLKGQLGIMFDENNKFVINNTILTYDNMYGLEYEKKKGE